MGKYKRRGFYSDKKEKISESVKRTVLICNKQTGVIFYLLPFKIHWNLSVFIEKDCGVSPAYHSKNLDLVLKQFDKKALS